MIKSCIIYKTKESYKIVTESESETGLLIASNPVFILSINSDLNTLKQKIFESLNSSQIDLPMPESKEKWKEWQKEQLKDLQEKTFNSLYKNSVSCQVKIEENVLGIYPYRFVPRQGLITIDEKVIKFATKNIDENEIVTLITDELQKLEIENHNF